MTDPDDTADGLGRDPRSLPRLLAETIDVEERLRAVKAAAAESGQRAHPDPTRDQVLVASAGAVAALVMYLRWRARRPSRGAHAGRHSVSRTRGLRRLLHRSAGRPGGPG
jgi:hypothetical protein